MSLIELKNMSLRDKIAQMFIVRGDKYDERFVKLGVGGIFLDKQKSKEDYKKLIKIWQENSRVKLFVSTDLEGYRNKNSPMFQPFRNFYQGKTFGEIKNSAEALKLGKEHAKLMKEMGFNLNFSPVVEKENIIYKGRTFNGSYYDVKNKIRYYIRGLRSLGGGGTAKHYPGSTLLKNQHFIKTKTDTSKDEYENFIVAINENIDAIMISHGISLKYVDSEGKQCTLSKKVINNLKKIFKGIVITDDIDMFGLKLSYLFNRNRMYLDLVKAGNDVILETHPTGLVNPFSSPYKRVKRAIDIIEQAVLNGEISEKRIDESVSRILRIKGKLNLLD